LGAFTLLAGASVAWATNPEAAFLEFDRAALYVGVFALAALSAHRVGVRTWCDGFAVGICGVTALALISRFFPSLLPSHDMPRFFPGSGERLSYPVDYWNGLAMLLALGVPALLRVAVAERKAAWRGLAAGALPAVAAAVYLTASRGGTATGIVAAAVFIALAADRWAALQAVFIALLGSAGAILILLDRHELTDAPLGSAGIAAEGRSAALLIAVVCVVTGLLHGVASSAMRRLPRPRRLTGWATAGLVVIFALVLLRASDPRERAQAFAQPPTAIALSRHNFVDSHFLSANGGGRWQFWHAAVNEFRSHPLVGDGAGSYEAWWAQHGSIPLFVRYAHSLYLEVLGELGVIGFVLLLAALGSGLFAGARTLTRTRSLDRTTAGALVAGLFAFLVAASIDWMWQLTVVSVVGVAYLGLVTASSSAVEAEPSPRIGRRFPRGILVCTALAVIACEGVPLLTQIELQQSRAAARGDHLVEASSHAFAAAGLEPWAASPYLQIALVEEQRRNLRSARLFINRALDRNGDDWRLWLVSARIETKLGAIPTAKQSLNRAARLNPRSPIFVGQVPPGDARR
jgi:hypothetical protein